MWEFEKKPCKREHTAERGCQCEPKPRLGAGVYTGLILQADPDWLQPQRISAPRLLQLICLKRG